MSRHAPVVEGYPPRHCRCLRCEVSRTFAPVGAKTRHLVATCAVREVDAR